MATVLGNLLADVYYVFVILKKSKRFSVFFADRTISGHMAGGIFAIGIPASITNLMQSLMIMLTNHFLLAYGTDKVAAMGIALKANMITALVLVGFAFGGQPLVGYNYGARNHKRLKSILKFAYLFEIALGLVFTLLICAFSPAIIHIFMQDTEIISTGAAMLRFQQFGMIFMAITLVSTCICQSVGKALGALVLSISRQGILYALALFVLSRLFGYTGILASQFCADIATALIALLILRKILRSITDKE